jgi:hypothetical protein
VLFTPSLQRAARAQRGGSLSGLALAAAVLGFFMITLDAVIVNIALPTIRHDLGGGITGPAMGGGWLHAHVRRAAAVRRGAD